MKPCQKQYRPQPDSRAVQRAPSGPPPAVLRRYVHPIRTTSSRPPAEELLSEVLTALQRQSEQLEEVLRRLECDKSDT